MSNRLCSRMRGVRLTTAATAIAASVMVADVTWATEPPAPIVAAPELCAFENSDWMRIAHLRDIQNPDELKQAFVDLILPEIRQVNDAIELDRAELEDVLARGEENSKMTLADRRRLLDLMSRYETRDLAELRIRIQPIPEAIALAQAALESGWGTSDLAQEGLAFFGQTRSSDGAYVRFPSIHASISAYALNLNTHGAYKAFRAARAKGEFSPWEMATTLVKYSELGQQYVTKVHGVMKSVKPHAPGILFASN